MTGRNPKEACELLSRCSMTTIRLLRCTRRSRCDLVFTVKMEKFRKKARNVLDVLPTLSYSSMMQRDSVRIALTTAASNERTRSK